MTNTRALVIVDESQEPRQQPGGAEMAQWQYKTLCTELKGSVDFDEELRKILQDYGMKGWELVQVLQPKNDALYHLVFKTERPLYPSLEPAQPEAGAKMTFARKDAL